MGRQFTPEAILEFNIFLDARAVAGERLLFKRLQQERKKSFKESMFLAAVARVQPVAKPSHYRFLINLHIKNTTARKIVLTLKTMA